MQKPRSTPTASRRVNSSLFVNKKDTSMNLVNNKTDKCSHCYSNDVRYYGLTVSAIHYYYECRNCHKFTEFHVTSKKLILELSPLILLAVIIVTLSAVKTTPLLALILFLGYIILLVVGYKYRWSFGEIIALDKLPNRLIVRAFPHKVRLIVITILSAALIGYIGLIVFNIIRQ
jgi:hypothetical protein